MPSASTGEHEAVELRDGNPDYYLGKSVEQAVDNVNTTIAGELLGIDAREQGMVDMLMLEADGTPNKSNFGANATLVFVGDGPSCSDAARHAVVALRWRYSHLECAPRANVQHLEWWQARGQHR